MLKSKKICVTVFLRIGTQIMCAKFRENQTKTVGAIWQKVWRHTHTHTHTPRHTDRQADTSINKFRWLQASNGAIKVAAHLRRNLTLWR